MLDKQSLDKDKLSECGIRFLNQSRPFYNNNRDRTSLQHGLAYVLMRIKVILMRPQIIDISSLMGLERDSSEYEQQNRATPSVPDWCFNS
jgi:hypothetical protein